MTNTTTVGPVLLLAFRLALASLATALASLYW